MNSAFVGYEELSRSRRVLSTSADNTLLNLLLILHILLSLIHLRLIIHDTRHPNLVPRSPTASLFSVKQGEIWVRDYRHPS